MTTYENRLTHLLKQVLEELSTIGITPAGSIIEIRENRRAKKRLGCCKREGTTLRPRYRLEISTMLAASTDRDLKEVIAHEVLHACKGCLNHGTEWKRLAAKVSKAYGYRIERTADYKRLGIDEDKTSIYKYRIKCRGCGNTTYRMKKSKVVQSPEKYRCSQCGGALEVDQI